MMKAYAMIQDNRTRQCIVGIGSNTKYYESIGMNLMDVEQGTDGNWYLAGYAPEQTPEQALAQAKTERAEAVSKITVEIDGMIFDGDEVAQQRMARAVANARAKADIVNAQRKADWMASWGGTDSEDGIPEEPAYDDYLDYETTWILANNEVRNDIKISQLAQAGTLAGQKQTELWVKPYEVTNESESV